MESFLNRYRNITVLLLVIMAQLVLLAVSAKNDQDVRMIRVWMVTAVTPVARIVEGVRGGSSGFLRNYVLLHDTNAENKKLRTEVDRLRLENTFLKNEINTADRAKALQVFQTHTPSKTLAASIFGIGAGSNSKVVLVDRGTLNGVQRSMAVVTPDGIVGKVIAAYPTASHVQLITDPEFAAGVATKSGARGTLKGQGTPQCRIDYVPFEDKVEVGDWVYTSGDDRLFPRGFVVGQVKSVKPAQPFKEVLVDPTGLQRGLEDVLIIIEGVHQEITEAPPGMQPVYIAPPVQGAPNPSEAQQTNPAGTEADRLHSAYKSLGQAQGHDFGDNRPGEKPPDYTKVGQPATVPAQGVAPATPPAGGRGSAGQPSSPGLTPPSAPAASQDAGRGQAAPNSRPSAGREPAAPITNPATPQDAGRGSTLGSQATPHSPPGNGREPAAPVKNPATPPGSGRGPAVSSPPTAQPPGGRAPSAGPSAAPQKSAPDPSRRTNQAAGPGGQNR